MLRPEIAKIKAAESPEVIDPGLWEQLKAELVQVLNERHVSQVGQHPPVGEHNRITDLELVSDGAGGYLLQWTYVNVGDYDQNAEVNISDLTPIGLHFGKVDGSPDWDEAQLADGDRNGEVNIADVTPIGQNYMSFVAGYYMYGAALPTGPWTELGSVEFSEGVKSVLQLEGNRVRFSVPFATDDYAEYKVEPFSATGSSLEPPANLQASDGTYDDRVVLTWTKSEGATAYDVYRDVQTTVYDSVGDANTYEDTNVPDQSIHTYWVKAKDQYGESDFSASDTGYRGEDIPPPPEEGYWPCYGGDLQNSGRSAYRGPSRLELKWRFDCRQAVGSSPAVAADGTIYVGSDYDRLFAVNPDGSKKWEFKASVHKVQSSPAIGSDGTIYFGAGNAFIFRTNAVDYVSEGGGILYALKPDGTEKWQFPSSSPIFSSPKVDENGTIYFGCHDRYFYALNPDGTEKWRFETFDAISSSPAISEDGTVYFCSDDDNLYAMNPATGDYTWRYFINLYALKGSPVIDSDGMIYALGEFHIHAVNPDGSQAWEKNIDHLGLNGFFPTSPSVGHDGNIYYGTFGGSNVYGVDPQGEIIWDTKLRSGSDLDTNGPANVFGKPAIDAAGRVYIGSDWPYAAAPGEGRMWIILPDGTIRDSEELDAYVRSSPAIGPDRTIYFGADDGYLYAYENPQLEPPADVEASDGTSPDFIRVSWTPNPHATVYRIYRDDPGNLVAELDPTDHWNDETFTLVEPEDYDTHTYWVSSVMDDIASALSTPDTGHLKLESFEVDITAPLQAAKSVTTCIVAGRPAVVFHAIVADGLGGNKEYLYYSRASDPLGKNWGGFVTLASGSYDYVISHDYRPCLALIEGNPAVSYWDWSTDSLKVTLASDEEGSVWQTPLTVFDGSGQLPCRVLSSSLCIVNGLPAVAFVFYHDQDPAATIKVYFTRALDSSYSTWLFPLEILGSGGQQPVSLAIVNGYPAILYNTYAPGEGQLRYVTSDDHDGSNWPAYQLLSSTSHTQPRGVMTMVGDRVAASFRSGQQGLSYIRAMDERGSAWTEPILLDSESEPLAMAMTMIGGVPGITYTTDVSGQPGRCVSYIEALDPAGISWGEPAVVLSGISQFINVGQIAIVEIAGYPAICCSCDPIDGDAVVRYMFLGVD